jgi:hypothetical protein
MTMIFARYICKTCGTEYYGVANDLTKSQHPRHRTSLYCRFEKSKQPMTLVKGSEENTIVTVDLRYGGKIVVDTQATESEMRNRAYGFFKRPFGSRETYIIHKGCIIVRYSSDIFGRGKLTRHTAVHLYGMMDGDYDMTCVSATENLHTIAQARALIDRIIANKSRD